MKRKLWLKFMDFLWSRLHSIMTPLCHKKHTSTLIYSGKNSNEGTKIATGGDFTKIAIFHFTHLKNRSVQDKGIRIYGDPYQIRVRNRYISFTLVFWMQKDFLEINKRKTFWCSNMRKNVWENSQIWRRDNFVLMHTSS